MTFRGDPEFGASGFAPLIAPRGLMQSSRSVTPAPEPSPWSAVYLEPKQRDRACSHIVHGKVSQFKWKGCSALSIKTVFSGTLNLQCGPAAYRIEPDTFLVLNHGSEYAVQVDPSEPVDGLSVFFDEHLVQSELRRARKRLEDTAYSSCADRLNSSSFYERIHANAEILSTLRRIHACISNNCDAQTVRSLHAELLEQLIDLQIAQWTEVEAVSAVRSVTKEELYRSLHRARDHAYASLDRTVSVDELAYVACLSTNYFLRSFRALFGLTPHQYLIQCRLGRAQQLLLETDLGVSAICHRVGFQSLGSFSWLFKRRVGISPERFRRKAYESEQNLKKVDQSLANLAGLGHTLIG